MSNLLLQNETNFSIVRFKDGELSRADDTIVTEFPITIKLNQVEFATWFASDANGHRQA